MTDVGADDLADTTITSMEDNTVQLRRIGRYGRRVSTDDGHKTIGSARCVLAWRAIYEGDEDDCHGYVEAAYEDGYPRGSYNM